MGDERVLKPVTIHTDGGCQGNPGPGGWAAVLRYGAHVREISGAEAATTNNRMELRAAIAALAALKQPCDVTLHTDSQYLRKGISEWMAGWKRNGWRTADKKPVKNDDLWRELDREVARHRVAWKWVKGHAGHDDNERCDVLAGAQIDALRRRLSPADLKAARADFVAGRGPGLPVSGGA